MPRVYTADLRGDLLETVRELNKEYEHLKGKSVRIINTPNIDDPKEGAYLEHFVEFAIIELDEKGQPMKKGRMNKRYGIYAMFRYDLGTSFSTIGTGFDEHTILVRAIG